MQETFINDFDSIYDYPNADINILDNNIKVTVENEQCALKIIFDKNKNYLYTESKDKVCSIPIFIIGLLVYGFGIAIAFLFLSLLILFILISIFEWIYRLRYK